MTAREFPNVRLRLRRTIRAPGAPDTDTTVVLWLNGSRFRLRDEAGRSYPDLLADITSGRGFGRSARTLEDFMDAWTAADRSRPPTEIYADLATDRATVVESGGPAWPIDAGRLAGLAGQVFTDERELDLEPIGHTRRLGRDCAEYRFAIEGEENGVPYRSEERWLVSSPYLLRRVVDDLPARRLRAVTEVVELLEGVVTEDDVAP